MISRAKLNVSKLVDKKAKNQVFEVPPLFKTTLDGFYPASPPCMCEFIIDMWRLPSNSTNSNTNIAAISIFTGLFIYNFELKTMFTAEQLFDSDKSNVSDVINSDKLKMLINVWKLLWQNLCLTNDDRTHLVNLVSQFTSTSKMFSLAETTTEIIDPMSTVRGKAIASRKEQEACAMREHFVKEQQAMLECEYADRMAIVSNELDAHGKIVKRIVHSTSIKTDFKVHASTLSVGINQVPETIEASSAPSSVTPLVSNNLDARSTPPDNGLDVQIIRQHKDKGDEMSAQEIADRECADLRKEERSNAKGQRESNARNNRKPIPKPTATQSVTEIKVIESRTVTTHKLTKSQISILADAFLNVLIENQDELECLDVNPMLCVPDPTGASGLVHGDYTPVVRVQESPFADIALLDDIEKIPVMTTTSDSSVVIANELTTHTALTKVKTDTVSAPIAPPNHTDTAVHKKIASIVLCQVPLSDMRSMTFAKASSIIKLHEESYEMPNLAQVLNSSVSKTSGTSSNSTNVSSLPIDHWSQNAISNLYTDRAIEISYELQLAHFYAAYKSGCDYYTENGKPNMTMPLSVMNILATMVKRLVDHEYPAHYYDLASRMDVIKQMNSSMCIFVRVSKNSNSMSFDDYKNLDLSAIRDHVTQFTQTKNNSWKATPKDNVDFVHRAIDVMFIKDKFKTNDGHLLIRRIDSLVKFAYGKLGNMIKGLHNTSHLRKAFNDAILHTIGGMGNTFLESIVNYYTCKIHLTYLQRQCTQLMCPVMYTNVDPNLDGDEETICRFMNNMANRANSDLNGEICQFEMRLKTQTDYDIISENIESYTTDDKDMTMFGIDNSRDILKMLSLKLLRCGIKDTSCDNVLHGANPGDDFKKGIDVPDFIDMKKNRSIIPKLVPCTQIPTDSIIDLSLREAFIDVSTAVFNMLPIPDGVITKRSKYANVIDLLDRCSEQLAEIEPRLLANITCLETDRMNARCNDEYEIAAEISEELEYLSDNFNSDIEDQRFDIERKCYESIIKLANFSTKVMAKF